VDPRWEINFEVSACHTRAIDGLVSKMILGRDFEWQQLQLIRRKTHLQLWRD